MKYLFKIVVYSEDSEFWVDCYRVFKIKETEVRNSSCGENSSRFQDNLLPVDQFIFSGPTYLTNLVLSGITLSGYTVSLKHSDKKASRRAVGRGGGSRLNLSAFFDSMDGCLNIFQGQTF